MKIHSELAKNSVKNSNRSSAVFYSILIAVVMLGTLLFIYSELELSQWKYHQEMFGDYHAILYNISTDEYKQLLENVDIETLELSKGIFIENTNSSIDATIWFKNERDTYTSMRNILKDFERESEDELLKSTGMTPRQVSYLVLEKASRLSLKPILWGLILAYGCTNLLFYLMWLNGQKNLMYGEVYQFKLVIPNPLVFIVLFTLALLCVFLSALKPARKSSKLSIVESMKGIQIHKSKMGLSFNRDSQNVIRGLAKDNALSYNHTFRGLALAVAL